MRRPAGLTLPLFLLLAGCSGTRPDHYGDSSMGFSAVLLGGRVIVPTGETKDASLALNLESEAERYRLRVRPGQTSLYRIEPGLYRLHPTRGLFGFVQPRLRVTIAGRVYRVPFPREIMRMDPYDIKPTKVVAIGVLEARLHPIVKGKPRRIDVRIDSSPETRRLLVEDVIEKMMDPKTPVWIRDASISWTRALEQSLIGIQGEERKVPIYKPSQ